MKPKPPLPTGISLNQVLQIAKAAWNRKDFSQCFETMEAAHRRAPSNADILIELARLYALRYNFAAAERCLEKAGRVSTKKYTTFTAAAEICRDYLNQPVLAEFYFQRAAAQPAAMPETFIHLAELHERQSRLDVATELLDRVLHLAPTHPEALLARARLNRLAGRLDEAKDGLRSIPANAETGLRVRAAYELGNILDRQGDYDEAMTAFLKAKTLLLPQAAQPQAFLKIMRTRMQELHSNITAEILQRWFEAGPQLPPSRRMAWLGGHPRSGTTLLEQVLDAHPDIIAAEELDIFTEEAYFPLAPQLPPGAMMLSVLETSSIQALQQSRKNYFGSMESVLGQPLSGRLLIDKNPSLIALLPALVRIFPEIKLLVALRDPRDVVLSCFVQSFTTLNASNSAYLSLESTVAEYTALMGMWRTVKPLLRNPYLEVRYEDMVNDLESVARKTLDFLDAPWDAQVLGFDKHARQKLVRSPTYADVTQPVYKRAVGRWQHYQKYLEPHLATLEPFVKSFGYE